jgi:hypothetical protein
MWGGENIQLAWPSMGKVFLATNNPNEKITKNMNKKNI